MAWPVTANPSRFDEAMEFFEERVPILEEDLVKLKDLGRSRSFVISGATELRVVQTIFNEIAKAVESGEPIDVFRKRVKAKLRGDWTRAASARLDTTFITVTQTAYNTGRFKQLNSDAVKRTRPFWLYDAVLDSRTTLICESLNGTLRPADDEFWSGHYPPMHHRCRSGIRSIRRSTAKEAGVTTDENLPDPKIPPGFGKTPDKATPFKPKKSDFDPKVWESYQAKQATMRSNARQRDKDRPA